MKPLAFVLPLAALSAFAVSAEPAPKPDPELTRLTGLARVWVTADYFHPYLAYKNIDWDKALTTALPKIRTAHGSSELASAYNILLSALGDKSTFAASDASIPLVIASGPVPQRSRFHHGFARDDGKSQTFYSGFLSRDVPSSSQFSSFDLDGGVHVQLRLSEPALGAPPADATARKRAFLEEAFPSEEGRILAAFRLWGAVRYFFAYKDLIDDDWDKIFAEYLPKVIAAQDARAYHLTLAELISHLSDSNALVSSAVLSSYFGEASPSVRVRLIEKKPVLVQLSDEARQAGAKLGDVITKIDGENSVERIRREANYLSASTPAGLGDLVARTLLNGASNTPVRLNVARAGGLEAEYALPRTPLTEKPFERPAGNAERSLPGSVAYLDLDHLSSEQIHTAYQRFQNARAIIFDLRGNCNADPYQLTEAFPEGFGRQSSIVTGPVANEPDLPSHNIDTATSSYFRLIRIPKPGNSVPPFGGKVVLLIDERTRGLSEQALLLLSAAARVQTVGNPSGGAPSEATELHLPGNLFVSFSGQDVRLTNGGAIQRQGIQPVLTAPVTLAGVRAGRDEVLDVALAWLNEELSTPVLH